MPRIRIKSEDNQWLKFLNEVEEVSFDDLGELHRLMEASRERGLVQAPPAVAADAPVRVGGIRLYRPSIAAADFMRGTIHWFANEREWEYRVLLDARILAYGRRPARLAQLSCESVARRVLDGWRPRLGVTVDELVAAVAAAQQGFPEAATFDPEAAPMGSLAYVAAMVKRFGGDHDYWLWDVSLAKALWIEREVADAEAEKLHQKPSVKGALQGLRALRRRIREEQPAEAAEA